MLEQIFAFARFEQTEKFLRRAMGLKVGSMKDFLPNISQQEGQKLKAIAGELRGNNPPSGIFLHGVLPRSGSNYVASAIAQHPDVWFCPRRIWEFPLLHTAGGAKAYRHEFIASFPDNHEVLDSFELLAYMASAWVLWMQAEAGGRRILLKSPHMQMIGLFPYLFPHDKLVLCQRDGRDVAASSTATFKKGLLSKNLKQLAHEWQLATTASIKMHELYGDQNEMVSLVRFEDCVAKPKDTVHALLERLDLPARTYPFDKLEDLPVIGSSTNKIEGKKRWRPVKAEADFSPVGRWKSWPERQQRAFLEVAGSAMRQAGYI